jgi:hypothetical protein
MSTDYFAVNEFDKFNDNIFDVVNKEEVEAPEAPVPFNPNEFESEIVKAEDLDFQLQNLLVDLFDDNVSAYTQLPDDEVGKQRPDANDIINASLFVASITKDGIPIAGAVVSDPTKINYRGVVPSDHYEMMSGISLEGRLRQEYFSVHPDYHNKGMADELRRLITTMVDATFVIVPPTDEDTIIGLQSADYTLVSEFDDNGVDVQLWVD